MIEITENIIKYFKSTFNVDVSTIPMFFKDLGGYTGIYDHDNPGMIFVDRQELDKHHVIYGYCTIVHELTHLIQFEYGQSLSIKLKPGENAGHYDYWDEEWCDKPLEVDAMLSEIAYLSSVDKNNTDNIIKYGIIRLQHTKEDVLRKAINNLNCDERFMTIINTVFNDLIAIKEVAIGLDK